MPHQANLEAPIVSEWYILKMTAFIMRVGIKYKKMTVL